MPNQRRKPQSVPNVGIFHLKCYMEKKQEEQNIISPQCLIDFGYL